MFVCKDNVEKMATHAVCETVSDKLSITRTSGGAQLILVYPPFRVLSRIKKFGGSCTCARDMRNCSFDVCIVCAISCVCARGSGGMLPQGIFRFSGYIRWYLRPF